MTAESILDREDFEHILSLIDEPVEYSSWVLTLIDRAKELGVKSKFETMLKAHKKEYEKKQKELLQLPQEKTETISHMTAFSGKKYPIMNCGRWMANDNGIFIEDTKTGEVAKICRHPIIPIQRMINIHTDKEKIKLAYKPMGKWKEITVDKLLAVDSAKIIKLASYSINVTSDTSKYLVKYLADLENLNKDDIAVVESTSKMGWVNDKFVPFCDEYGIDSDGAFKDISDSIKPHGSEETWMELAKSVRTLDRVEPKISLIASLASVLIEPLNALPFMVNLWSETGRGKTVSMMLATSVWASPANGAYMADAKSTATGLEVTLEFLNSLPLMLDDMSQVKEKHQGDFSSLVYYLCSGKGKGRSNQDLGINKPKTWKNIILTNYEHPLVSEGMQGGAINRIIDIEMKDGQVFENGNYIANILKENYGHIGRKFVELVSSTGIEKIREIQKKAYNKIIEISNQQGVEKEEKQVLPLSIILTADFLATKYIFQDGQYLDINECVDWLKNKGEVSENERAYEYIMSAVNINLNKFTPDDRGEYKGEMWGLFKDGYVYIMSNIFTKFCTEGKFSRQSFLTWAEKRDLLDCGKGRKVRQKRLDGLLSWCVCLKTPNIKTDDTPTDEDGFISVEGLNQEELPFN